jgi:3-methyladenine DNA glycosylase AlkD
MNKHHKELLRELKKQAARRIESQRQNEQNYIGSTKICYGISVPTKQRIVKNWIRNHPDLTFSEYLQLLNSLSSGKSHDEFGLLGKLLKFLPKYRRKLNPSLLRKWLERAEGWAEVDSICQSNFSAQEILSNWKRWKSVIRDLSLDKNVHKRRASLVLLTGPVRESSDSRLSQLAFEVIERLKREKEILVTKAISWLLRSLTKHHRQKVKAYLAQNQNILPKLAVRETSSKLLTGRKQIKK